MRIDKSLHYILFMGMGIVWGLIAVAPRFVPWFFGPDYTEVILLLQFLSPVILIIGISNCLGSQYYTPAGLRKQSTRYIIIGAIVNYKYYANTLLWGKRCCYRIAQAEMTITILYLCNCKGYMTLKQIVLNGWRKCLAAIVMFILVRYTVVTISNGTKAILSSVCLGVSVYCGMLIILRDPFVCDAVPSVCNRICRW